MTTVLVLAGSAAGYAAWHDDAADPSSPGTSRAGGKTPPGADASSAPKAAPSVTSAPASASKGNGGAKTVATQGFTPVVTDRIPIPTKSLALSAPVPGTTNMQAPAAAAFKAAFADARAAGLTPEIRSAWRSAQWQQVLFDRAVAKYGSSAEASKWVLSPVRSAHVKGYAIDVRPQSVATWLERHGSDYGLCRTYDNEWWHFEYLATSTCPARRPTAAG